MVGLAKEYNKKKPMVGVFLPHFFLDVSGSIIMFQSKLIIELHNPTYSHTNICVWLGMMSEAFQNNGRPFEIIKQAKTHGGNILATLLSRCVYQYLLVFLCGRLNQDMPLCFTKAPNISLRVCACILGIILTLQLPQQCHSHIIFHSWALLVES
jgi:hypothetical protein